MDYGGEIELGLIRRGKKLTPWLFELSNSNPEFDLKDFSKA